MIVSRQIQNGTPWVPPHNALQNCVHGDETPTTPGWAIFAGFLLVSGTVLLAVMKGSKS